MVLYCRRNVLCVLVGLACAASYGKELPDLIARLQKLEGDDPVRAAVQIEDSTPRAEAKGSRQSDKVDLAIAAGANTLTLTVTGKIPNTTIFREFSLLRASELVHYGPSLAREMTGLKLVERLPDSHEGVSCVRWRLQSEEKRSSLGMSGSRRRDVELWIDADGYPIAASFKTKSTTNVLLYKQSQESTREHRYKRWGDRLVLVRDKQDEAMGKGKGAHRKRVTTTVELKRD